MASSIDLPSDDDGAFPAPVSPCPDDGIVLPSDDNADSDVEVQPKKQRTGRQTGRQKRRRYAHHDGKSRQELLEANVMVHKRVPCLWEAQVPRHLQGQPRDHIMEVYSPRRVLAVAVDEMELSGEVSADLETGWDFTKLDHRIALVIQVKARRPEVLVLSPPCTLFSTLMNLNWCKMPRATREAKFLEGLLHLEFCCLLMDLQISEGRKVVFEHPQSALSWQNSQLKEIAKLPGVSPVHFDMCEFGLVSPIEGVPLQKATVILSNLPQLLTKLRDKKCKGMHKHKVIQGKEGGILLSTWAQRYPREFCEVIAYSTAEHVHCHA